MSLKNVSSFSTETHTIPPKSQRGKTEEETTYQVHGKKQNGKKTKSGAESKDK